VARSRKTTDKPASGKSSGTPIRGSSGGTTCLVGRAIEVANLDELGSATPWLRFEVLC
jgi:hypothetical protein